MNRLLLFILFFSCLLLSKGSATSNQQNIEKGGFMESSSSQVTKTTYKTWGDKFAESFYLCIIGVILFICSFPILWYNERRAVRTSQLINDGNKNCVEINSSEIQKANNGRLVFLSGLAQTESNLKDDEVGLELEKALKLVRKVEMYQWQEKKQQTSRRDTFGGGETTSTTYTYSKIWSETQISDSDFQDQSHVNPSFERWILHSEKFLSKDTHIGNFRLNDGELEQLKNLKHYELRQDFESLLTDELKRRIKDYKITVTNNYLYLRVPTSNFEESIGDIRVSYQFSDEQYLSIVACQSDDMLVPYDLRTKGIKQIDLERNPLVEKHDEQTGACCCICYGAIDKICQTPSEIDWVFQNKFTQRQAFDEKEKENSNLTWVFRLLGFLCMLGGIWLFFSPVYEFLQILPLLSSLGKLVVFFFALLISIPITLVIILIAWIFYRPVVACILLAIITVFAVTLGVILSKSQHTVTQ